MINIILSSICLLLAMGGFGLMDELAHHYNTIKLPFVKNNPQFWDKNMSWINKWKPTPYYDPISQTIREEYKKEKFWRSSRQLVFLTDGWHLVQFISYQLIAMSIGFLISEHIWVALLLSLLIHAKMATTKWAAMKYL